MRRVEVTSSLSPSLWRILEILLDVEQKLLQEAWRDCREPGRGYFITKITHPVTGKLREIHHPTPQMKRVQQRILTQVLYQLPVSSAAFGGVRGRSYVQAARTHLKQPGYLLQLDLAEAFPSTTFSTISKHLRRALKPHLWVFQCTREERKVIVGWLTHLMVVSAQGGRFPRLPLGTPTSLSAFNVVWGPIDREIKKILKALMPQQSVRYTRYVDDLTFSCDVPLQRDLEASISAMLKGYSYSLNTDKTHAAHRDQAMVHGLCWRDDFLSLPEPKVVNISKKVHRLQGLLHGHPTSQDWEEGALLLEEVEGICAHIYGRGPRPQGLLLDDALVSQIKQRASRPSPQWADELWG